VARVKRAPVRLASAKRIYLNPFMPLALSSLDIISPNGLDADLFLETAPSSLLNQRLINLGGLAFAGTGGLSGGVDLTPLSKFTVCGWVKYDAGSIGSDKALWAQFRSTGNQRSYLLRKFTDNKLDLIISDDGISSELVEFANFTFAADTWYFIAMVLDYDEGVAKVSVNGSAFEEQAVTNTSTYSASVDLFTLGYYDSVAVTRELDGTMDGFCAYESALTLAEVQAFYNGGEGVTYADLSAAQKTDLLHWFDMNERGTITTVADAHGSENLTNVGGVTEAVGIVQSAPQDGDAVYRWEDLSVNNNHPTQDTAANMPTYIADGVQGNGVDQSLDLASPITYSGAFTIIGVIKSADGHFLADSAGSTKINRAAANLVVTNAANASATLAIPSIDGDIVLTIKRDGANAISARSNSGSWVSGTLSGDITVNTIMGKRLTATATPFGSGFHSAWVLFPSELSSNQIQLVETYLQKYLP
jgi:hypothetical protein